MHRNMDVSAIMTEVDTALLGRLVQDLTNAVLTMKDEVNVQGAILSRVDLGQNAMLNEMRAMRQQMSRVLDRMEQNDRRITAVETK